MTSDHDTPPINLLPEYERNYSKAFHPSHQNILLKLINVTVRLIYDFFIKFATKTQVTTEFLL